MMIEQQIEEDNLAGGATAKSATRTAGALQFKPVELRDKTVLQPFFDYWQFEGSELSFSNLYLWQPWNDIEYCVHCGVLYIRLCEEGRLCFMPPIPVDSSANYGDALGHLANYAAERGSNMEIRCANTKLKALMEACCWQNLRFEEDRANFDYIYLTRDLIELSGGGYHGKRNHINKFLSEYDCAYETYDDSHFAACMELYMNWRVGKDVHPGEPRAVKTALLQHKELGLTGCVLLVGGRVVAFSMGEKLTRNMAVIHIEKAILPGAYSYINQQFAKNAWSDMTYINREEDMGVEGMRKAKMSYHPAYLIEKYTVTLGEGIGQ